MIYRFKSQATADLIMMGPQGDHILRLIGKTPEPQGIITVAQLPAAIEALRAAVEADERGQAPAAAAQEAASASEDEATGDDDAADDMPVSLRQRAQPLLAMLRAALAERQDVVWGV